VTLNNKYSHKILRVKTHSKELKRAMDVKFCHKIFFKKKLSFETKIIMAHYIFLTHMHVKKFKLKIYLI